jgi:histidine 2-aminobutanoyltransferase
MNVRRTFPQVEHPLETKLLELERDFGSPALGLDGLELRLEKLRRIVNCPLCHRAYSENWSDAREALLRRLQQRASQSIGDLEKAAAEKLSGDHENINRYLTEVSSTTIRHGEVADFCHRSRVLFVGSGALPLSCHTLVRHFGCEVVGLDSDLQAVERARALTKGSYKKRLTLLAGKGEEFPAEGFSHVVVASLVPGKEAMLEHLHRSVDSGCKVVCRFGNGLQRLLNYPLSTGPRKEWERLWLLGDMASLYQTLVFSRR